MLSSRIFSGSNEYAEGGPSMKMWNWINEQIESRKLFKILKEQGPQSKKPIDIRKHLKNIADYADSDDPTERDIYNASVQRLIAHPEIMKGVMPFVSKKSDIDIHSGARGGQTPEDMYWNLMAETATRKDAFKKLAKDALKRTSGRESVSPRDVVPYVRSALKTSFAKPFRREYRRARGKGEEGGPKKRLPTVSMSAPTGSGEESSELGALLPGKGKSPPKMIDFVNRIARETDTSPENVHRALTSGKLPSPGTPEADIHRRIVRELESGFTPKEKRIVKALRKAAKGALPYQAGASKAFLKVADPKAPPKPTKGTKGVREKQQHLIDVIERSRRGGMSVGREDLAREFKEKGWSPADLTKALTSLRRSGGPLLKQLPFLKGYREKETDKKPAKVEYDPEKGRHISKSFFKDPEEEGSWGKEKSKHRIKPTESPPDPEEIKKAIKDIRPKERPAKVYRRAPGEDKPQGIPSRQVGAVKTSKGWAPFRKTGRPSQKLPEPAPGESPGLPGLVLRRVELSPEAEKARKERREKEKGKVISRERIQYRPPGQAKMEQPPKAKPWSPPEPPRGEPGSRRERYLAAIRSSRPGQEAGLKKDDEEESIEIPVSSSIQECVAGMIGLDPSNISKQFAEFALTEWINSDISKERESLFDRVIG